MKVNSLVLSQFRCWTYRELHFSEGINYLKGPNASGKTSILEAINYLSTGRSFRATHDKTCVQWGKDSFSLRAVYEKHADEANPGSHSLSLSYGAESSNHQDKRRIVKLDDEFVEKLSDLRRVFMTVVFVPDDLGILKDGPSRRRAFVDDLLIRTQEDYLKWIKNYEETRKQRNSLLKSPSTDHVLLDQYDEKLAEVGRRIVEARSRVIPEVEEKVKENAIILLDDVDKETLSLEYDPDVPPGETLGNVLEESRGNDLEKGYTTRGPQRDDWTLKIKGRSVARFASQGQLRALLLTLKLAANSVIIKRISKVPILLLDDVESELDDDRQNQVLTLLRNCSSQVLITGTGHLNFSADGESETILTLKAR